MAKLFFIIAVILVHPQRYSMNGECAPQRINSCIDKASVVMGLLVGTHV
jgi:hypothetical protein